MAAVVSARWLQRRLTNANRASRHFVHRCGPAWRPPLKGRICPTQCALAFLHDGSTLCTDVGPPGVGAFQGRMCPTQLHWHFDDASTVCTDLRRNPPSKAASAQRNLHLTFSASLHLVHRCFWAVWRPSFQGRICTICVTPTHSIVQSGMNVVGTPTFNMCNQVRRINGAAGQTNSIDAPNAYKGQHQHDAVF